MADSLPSPPQSREPTPHNDVHATDTDDLAHRLDELLEKYLEILDEYTVLRQQLSQTFSNGFMSLAHAQRTSNLGPGRRYGQDGYDGRMKASKRVNIERREEHTDSSYPTTSIDSKSKTDVSRDIEYDQYFSIKPFPQIIHTSTGTEGGIEESQSELDTDIKNLSVKQELNSVKEGKEAASNSKKSNIDPAYRDPVTWYGILVPPALRQSQRSFVSSVEDVIPRLMSTACLLRSIESKIRLVREAISMKEAIPASDAHTIPHRPTNPTI